MLGNRRYLYKSMGPRFCSLLADGAPLPLDPLPPAYVLAQQGDKSVLKSTLAFYIYTYISIYLDGCVRCMHIYTCMCVYMYVLYM